MYFPNQNTTQVYSPFGTYVVEQHDKGSGKERRFGRSRAARSAINSGEGHSQSGVTWTRRADEIPTRLGRRRRNAWRSRPKRPAGSAASVLMAMARSWMTLANQMARLEATTIAKKARRRSTRPA